MTKKKADQRAAARGKTYNLNKPIVIPTGLQAADPKSWDAVEQQRLNRIMEACFFFGVDPRTDGALRSLVEAMIADRFPKSFLTISQYELEKTGGVPDFLMFVIIRAVEKDKKRAEAEHGKPLAIRTIIGTLKKDKTLFGRYTAEALRTAYRRQMKEIKDFRPVPIDEVAKSRRGRPKRR